MSNLFKVCMFVTSFIPLWISIFFIEVMSLIKKTKYFWSEIIMLTLIILVLPISIFVMIRFLGKKENEAVFDMAQHVITQSAGLINGSTASNLI